MIKLSDLKSLKVSRETLRAILVLIALGLFLLKFGYQGYEKRLQEKKKLYHELRQALFQKELLLKKESPVSGSLEDKEDSLIKQALSEVFPKKEDPLILQVEVSKTLTELAEKKGLKAEGFEFLAPSSGKRLTEIPILIRTSGPIKNTLEYLEEVQNYLKKKNKFYKIKEFSLATTGFAEKELRLTLQISFFKSEI